MSPITLIFLQLKRCSLVSQSFFFYFFTTHFFLLAGLKELKKKNVSPKEQKSLQERFVSLVHN